MIIQSLCRYYDILVEDEGAKVAPFGYGPVDVSFTLVLSDDGEISYIVDLRSDDKKPRPRAMDVPLHKGRSGRQPPAYFLCDKAKYVFGVEKKKKDARTAAKLSPDDLVLEKGEKEDILVTKQSRDCFEDFKCLHRGLLGNVDNPCVKRFLKFLETWNPESFLENPKLLEYKDEILSDSNLVIDCEGRYLHENNAVRTAWEKHLSQCMENGQPSAQCLVSGRSDSIARVHNKIVGVVGAHTAGASLITFNDNSFCSYGKEQGSNAPVSESAMFKYTTALNYLLAHPEYHMRIGDTTVVFWAETSGTACEDLASLFFDPHEKMEEDSGAEPSDPTRAQDLRRIELIGDILDKVRKGQKIRTEDIGADPEANFYILGLAPNNARLAVRFWQVDTFGDFIAKVAHHHQDMEIVRGDYDPRYVSVYRLLKETVARSSDKKASSTDKITSSSNKAAPSPLLGGLIMRSILNGTPYPVQMYNAILNRVKVERSIKTDKSINSVRAGLIKAYLLRLERAGLTNLQKDMITVSLNEENLNVPYRLGRLFAVLEKAQTDTNREMKSTINSKYFSSASTTPAVVFPVLLKLAQHHIAKSDWGTKSSRSIEQILEGIDVFPAFLNLEEQGMFMLGYYHQRKAFFTKKEEVASESE